MQNFGTRLKAMRENRNMTQAQLAEQCNSTAAVIRGYEKSRRLPYVEMLIKMCNALQATPDYLLQDELAFTPNADRKHIYNIIDSLTPQQITFLEDVLNSLKKQG